MKFGLTCMPSQWEHCVAPASAAISQLQTGVSVEEQPLGGHSQATDCSETESPQMAVPEQGKKIDTRNNKYFSSIP